jgi:NAD(P)-dependent dehydrogenase (short-subunit alcohol dehydrogenase family)
LAAIVSGGGSGLGRATAKALVTAGAKVVILDVNAAALAEAAAETGALPLTADVTDTEATERAVAAARERHGPARIVINCAGIGPAARIVSRDGKPMPLDEFRRVIEVNLIGTFNVTRLACAEIVKLEALTEGERGVVVNTASVAAFDGQVGQEAYAASKGGVVALTLPLARDLAQFGVRVVTIAPGQFQTPLVAELPQPVQDSLAASIPFPKRLGKPEEFAQLAAAIVENMALNGEVIRLDGALRMAPR